MRLRVLPASARAQLVSALTAHGGRVVASGDTLQLSYPVVHTAAPDQERVELTFFVRAWAAREPDAYTEVLG